MTAIETKKKLMLPAWEDRSERLQAKKLACPECVFVMTQ